MIYIEAEVAPLLHLSTGVCLTFSLLRGQVMNVDTKICKKCGLEKPTNQFGLRHVKKQNKYYIRLQCNRCYTDRVNDWNHRTGKHKSARDNRECSSFLGIVIAEEVASRYFKNVKRVQHNTPGYDLFCSNGYKIDVKSSSLQFDNGHS
jgi:hypothetical protein